jgi:hypothetical protein
VLGPSIALALFGRNLEKGRGSDSGVTLSPHNARPRECRALPSRSAGSGRAGEAARTFSGRNPYNTRRVQRRFLISAASFARGLPVECGYCRHLIGKELADLLSIRADAAPSALQQYGPEEVGHDLQAVEPPLAVLRADTGQLHPACWIGLHDALAPRPLPFGRRAWIEPSPGEGGPAESFRNPADSRRAWPRGACLGDIYAR